MAKHTPGPWRLETVKTSVGVCHKVGPFPSSGVRQETYACVYEDGLRWVPVMDRMDTELLANARLMAAAPELLDLVRAYSGTVQPATLAKLDKLAQALLARIDGGHSEAAS